MNYMTTKAKNWKLLHDRVVLKNYKDVSVYFLC